jgi:hypothetical protein
MGERNMTMKKILLLAIVLLTLTSCAHVFEKTVDTMRPVAIGIWVLKKTPIP